MRNITANIEAFLRDEEGLTMVEYAIAGALIAVGAGIAFGLLGGAVKNQVNKMTNCVGGNCT